MSENSVNLAEETLLRVKQLEIKFAHFEGDNHMTDCCLAELDEEMEEGRVSLEKLEKRVIELETGLPELIAERIASLKTENAELREHLNVTVDTLNKVVEIINEQVIPREPDDGGNPDVDDGVDHHHYLTEVYTDTQSTLQEQQELPTRVNGLTQDEWNDLLRI